MREKKDSNLGDSPIPYFIFSRPEMDFRRWLSLIIALIYLLISGFTGGAGGALRIFGFLIIPLVCIWFGEEMIEDTGSFSSSSIVSLTPGMMIRFIGWLLLLSPLWIPLVVGFIRWLN